MTASVLLYRKVSYSSLYPCKKWGSGEAKNTVGMLPFLCFLQQILFFGNALEMIDLIDD